jgi:cobalt-zinc-cadmium efflux system outer membrane protein
MDQWIDWKDGLSEEEATAVGLWNNPAYQELLADLQITQADIIQAAQLQNPQVITMLPIGVKQWEFALMVPLDVLWLRPIRVSAAELESHRVAERLVQDGLDVVRDVRVAYIDWQLAVQKAQLADQGAKLRSEIAERNCENRGSTVGSRGCCRTGRFRRPARCDGGHRRSSASGA